MQNVKILNFKINGNNSGSLVALEENCEIPFSIRRVYYIFDTKMDVTRGYHSHVKLQQVLICLNGSCIIDLDDGKKRKSIRLEYPNQGLYIGKNIWREMKNFSQGCVLLVLASDFYNPSEYIRNYDEFINSIKT